MSEADMKELMKGLGSGKAPPMSEADMKELMKGLGSGKAPPMSEADMKELMKFSGEALGSMKAALSNGTMTTADVQQIENMMGVDIPSLLGMIGGMSSKLEGSKRVEMEEIIGIFKGLEEIKTQGL